MHLTMSADAKHSSTSHSSTSRSDIKQNGQHPLTTPEARAFRLTMQKRLISDGQGDCFIKLRFERLGRLEGHLKAVDAQRIAIAHKELVLQEKVRVMRHFCQKDKYHKDGLIGVAEEAVAAAIQEKDEEVERQHNKTVKRAEIARARKRKAARHEDMDVDNDFT